MEENKKSKELIDDDLMEVSGGVGLEDAEDLEDAEVNDTVGGEIDAAESLESALRRFKRNTQRAGVIGEARKREHYEKPSVRRKKKAEAARKRKY